MAIQSPLDLNQTDQIPAPDDPLAVTQPTQEAPVDAGASAFQAPEISQPPASPFIEEDKYLMAMGPGLARALRSFKMKRQAVPEEPSIRIIEKALKPNIDINNTPWIEDPRLLSEQEAGELAKRRAQELIDSDLSDFDTTQTHQLNMRAINTEEQVKAVQAQLSEAYQKEIDAARGGVVEDDVLRSFAKDLETDPEFIAKFFSKGMVKGASVSAQALASKRIMEASATRLKQLAAQIVDGSDSTQVKAELLYQWDFHRQWTAQFMGLRAELGRGMRALRGDVSALNVVSPTQAQKDRMQELVKTWGNAVDVNQLADQIHSSKTLLGVNKIVKASESKMSRWGGAISEAFIGSLLFGIKTAIANTVGGVLMTTKGPFEVALAARHGRNLPSEADRVFIGEAQAMLFGMFSSFTDALGAGWHTLKTGEQYGGVGKFEMSQGRALTAEALNVSGLTGDVVNVIGSIARIPMERVLGPMDAFIKRLNEGGAYNQLAFREAMKAQMLEGLTDEETLKRLNSILDDPEAFRPGMLDEVVDYGLYTTFQRPLGPDGRKIQDVVNSWALLKIIAPFVRTPVNILKVAFAEGTPLAMFQKDFRYRTMPDPNTGAPANIAKAQMARARMEVGTAIASLFGMYVVAGKITGSGPRDPEARKLLQDTGWRPRSFVVTNDDGSKKYIPYDRYEPFSLTLGLIADAFEVFQMHQYDDLDASTEDRMHKLATAIAVSVAENTVNKTYMRGVFDAVKAANDPEAYMVDWATGVAQALVPAQGLRRDLRKVDDPYRRQAEGFLEDLKNNTPFYSTELPPQIDMFGNPKKYENPLNPYAFMDVPTDYVDEELRRILSKTNKAAVKYPEKKLYGSIDLTSQQYYEYLLTSRKLLKMNAASTMFAPGDVAEGQTYSFKEFLSEVLMKSDGYLNATDFERFNQIRTIQKQFDEAAQEILISQHPDLKEARDKFRVINPMIRRGGAAGVEEAKRQIQAGRLQPGALTKEAINSVNFGN